MSVNARCNNPPPPDIDFDSQHDEVEDEAPLNPDSLDAQTINWIIAQLTNPDVNILDVAASLNCSPASLLEIITHAAEFRSHVDAMRDLALLSAQIIASAALPRHTDTLIRIADDESVHPETRRKAIGALIRLARGMSLPRATSHTNGVAGAPPSPSTSSVVSASAAVASCSGATNRAQPDLCSNNHVPRATSHTNGTAGAPSSPPSSSSTSSSASSSGATGGLSTSATRPSNTSGVPAPPPLPVPGEGGGVTRSVTEGVSQSIATTDSSQSIDSEPRASARACTPESPEPQPTARIDHISDSALHDTHPNHLEHSDSPLHQYIDDLLTLDDEALFKEARAAAQSLIDRGIIPRTSIRAGPASTA